MKVIELSDFRRLSIGTSGDLRVSGGDVMPRHAIIEMSEADGRLKLVIRPIDGQVFVERLGIRHAVQGPWPLENGDVCIIGKNRIQYRQTGRAQFQSDGEVGDISWAS